MNSKKNRKIWRCNDCQEHYIPEPPNFDCPKCQSNKTMPTSLKELPKPKSDELRGNFIMCGIIPGIPTDDEIEIINKSNYRYITVFDQSLIGAYHQKPNLSINKLAQHGWKVVTMSTHAIVSGMFGSVSYMYIILERKNE